MYVNKENYFRICEELKASNATLVAVSKTKPSDAIRELYDLGQRDFGENYVQELLDKQTQLPADIRWHFIGHLQTNKAKYIAPFVHLVHGVDSFKLLKELGKQGKKNDRTISVLLQVHIAQEETKFGLGEKELDAIIGSPAANSSSEMSHVSIRGLMGMASFSPDKNVVRQEFRLLQTLFERYKKQDEQVARMEILSMGMSGDYQLALEEGSNMVRIGSLLFGARS